MFVFLAEYLVRYRWLILPPLIVVTLLAAATTPWIKFDFTPQAVFTDHCGLVEYSERFKDDFGHDDAVLVMLVEATGDRDVLDRNLLTWQEKIARQCAAIPDVESVRCVATLEMPRPVVRRPWVVPAPIIRDFPVSGEAEARVRATLKRSELLNGTLISEDRRVSAIVVTLDPDAREIGAMERVVAAVDGCLEATPPPSGYRLHHAGFPAVRVDIVKQLKADLEFLIPVAGIALVLATGIAYRCVSGTLVPLVAVGAGVAWTSAMLVVSGQTMSIISSILPVLMLTIGMSNCVHVVNRYAEHRGETRKQRHAAVRTTISHMAAACFLTFLTTAIGFLSLTATRSNVLVSFGTEAGIGMGFLYVSTILFSATLLPSFRPPRINTSPLSPSNRFADAASHVVCRHPWTVLLCSAALVVVSLWGARDVVINAHMMESYEADHPTIKAMHLIEDKLSGYISLDVSLSATKPGQFLEPDVYRRVAEAERFADENKDVIFARSYVDLLQQIPSRPGRPNPPASKMPLGEAGRQRLQRSDEWIRRFANSMGYFHFMTPDGKRTRIMLRVKDIGTRESLALIGELETKLGELFPADGPIKAELTGDAYVYAKSIDRFVRALLYSLLGASIVIFALIAVLFRSFWLGMISIVPNLTPLVVTLGYMALRGYELNITHAIVFAISLGVAVDGTIHFLARFRKETRRTKDGEEAICHCFQGAGRAIVLANILLLCGLAVLFLSDFLPTRRFAELGSVTMAAALVGDLLLLPACLMLYHRCRHGKRTTGRV